MSASTYTLDEALDIVASASFYEDKLVTPLGNGRFTVEGEAADIADGWLWTYADGVANRDSVSEVSRLMESYEHFARASHIRHHMSNSIQALEAGTHSVSFAYATVDVSPEDPEYGECCDRDDCDCDTVVGWILVAMHYEIDCA